MASAAPSGDGRWHPATQVADTAATIPDLAQALLAGQPVTEARAGSLNLLDRRGFQVDVSAPCATVLTGLNKAATGSGLAVQASGSVGATAVTPANSWFVVRESPVSGLNLALTAGAAPTSCIVAGVELTPVELQLTGPAKGTVTTFTAVTCGPSSAGEIVGIWGVPLTGAKPSMSLMVAVAATGVGAHELGADDVGYLVRAPIYSMGQLNATTDLDTGLPTDATPLTGSITLQPGLASGSLDLSGGGEHITGTFECGTPVVEQ